MKPALRNIIISRTDSIGDVVLTLPLAAILKKSIPGIRVAFLGKSYTRAVIECCAFVDDFIDVADFGQQPILLGGLAPEAIVHVFPVKAIAQRAKALSIPFRIGTTNRLYHWGTCNKLVRLSRRNSDLHEAQLNARLLAPLGIPANYSLAELGGMLGFTNVQPLPAPLQQLTDSARFNLILHPNSQGSAREWGIPNFVKLIQLLPKDRYKIFISGTASERESLGELFVAAGHLVTDITGQMDLTTFISFIAACDGLVANSTGPLHIAAALGKRAIGIYPDIRPMHPGRWQPIGPDATFVTTALPSMSMESILPEQIFEKLEAK